MNRRFVLSCLLFAVVSLPCAATTLDEYIRLGLQGNLALRQQELSLEKSLQALREVRGLYLPSLGIEARISAAGGGRTIDFPVGDLVNPIHLTLNQLLQANGQAPVFPGNLENINIPFYRPFEHDTRLRLVQGIFVPTLYPYHKIRRELSDAERLSCRVFARRLVLDIKTAYFNHLKAVRIGELLDETRKLLEENVRVSHSLFANQAATEEVVFRSQAELSKLDQQRSEAARNLALSRSYFNFLLNRPLTETIDIQPAFVRMFDPVPEAVTIEEESLRRREELMQLGHAATALSTQVRLHRAEYLPTLNAVIDYGFQADKLRFGKSDDFWMASLMVNWNLFNGFQSEARRKQAHFEQRRVEKQREEAAANIRLQLQDAVRSLQVAEQVLVAAAATQRLADASFAIIARKYEQRIVPQIEFIQAQNEATAARVGYQVALYELYIREAELEQCTARYALPNKEK
jgi:outer membrane protein TolC